MSNRLNTEKQNKVSKKAKLPASMTLVVGGKYNLNGQTYLCVSVAGFGANLKSVSQNVLVENIYLTESK